MREPMLVTVEGRRYRLRCPSVADIATFKRQVRLAGGRRHAYGDKLILIEQGLRAIGEEAGAMDDPVILEGLEEVAAAKERLRDLVGEMQSGATAEMEPEAYVAMVEAALNWTPRLAHAAGVVERHYRPYAEALADEEVYPEIAARVALDLFLEAAEGLTVPVRRTLGGLAPETMEAVPASDLTSIFSAWQSAVEASEAEKKGFKSLSSGASSPSSSTGSSTRRRNGRSRSARAGTSANGTSGSSASIPGGPPSPGTMN